MWTWGLLCPEFRALNPGEKAERKIVIWEQSLWGFWSSSTGHSFPHTAQADIKKASLPALTRSFKTQREKQVEIMTWVPFISAKTMCRMKGLKAFPWVPRHCWEFVWFSPMTLYFLKSPEACERFLNVLKERTVSNISKASAVMYHEYCAVQFRVYYNAACSLVCSTAGSTLVSPPWWGHTQACAHGKQSPSLQPCLHQNHQSHWDSQRQGKMEKRGRLTETHSPRSYSLSWKKEKTNQKSGPERADHTDDAEAIIYPRTSIETGTIYAQGCGTAPMSGGSLSACPAGCLRNLTPMVITQEIQQM